MSVDVAKADALDLFAGPGGWSVALQRLGLSEYGIEWDKAACETARAAGHHRDHRDVRDFTPQVGQFEGLIASPPCQTFSAAGKGAGRASLDALLAAVDLVATGEDPATAIDRVGAPGLDDRSVLALEPLRYIVDCAPKWVALEQVPAVLPVWQRYAFHLASWGYSVDTALLNAEMFGVPQTRKRAILVANLDKQVSLPTPTHSRYYSRTPEKLDPGVKKWVSMAEALGSVPGVLMRSNYGTGGNAADRGERLVTEPAPTVTSKIGRNKWVFVNGNQPNSARRIEDAPAPTVHFAERQRVVTWEPVAAVPGDTSWVYRRPSPTIVGSFKPEVVAAPGYRTDVSRQNAPGPVKVTVQEAAVLQSFPADYPWQGSKTSQYRQVGDAIPCLLAEAVIDAARGVDVQ